MPANLKLTNDKWCSDRGNFTSTTANMNGSADSSVCICLGHVQLQIKYATNNMDLW